MFLEFEIDTYLEREEKREVKLVGARHLNIKKKLSCACWKGVAVRLMALSYMQRFRCFIVLFFDLKWFLIVIIIKFEWILVFFLWLRVIFGYSFAVTSLTMQAFGFERLVILLMEESYGILIILECNLTFLSFHPLFLPKIWRIIYVG